MRVRPSCLSRLSFDGKERPCQQSRLELCRHFSVSVSHVARRGRDHVRERLRERYDDEARAGDAQKRQGRNGAPRTRHQHGIALFFLVRCFAPQGTKNSCRQTGHMYYSVCRGQNDDAQGEEWRGKNEATASDVVLPFREATRVRRRQERTHSALVDRGRMASRVHVVQVAKTRVDFLTAL